MSRAREQANLSSDSNIFVDIANDRTGIGITTPSQKLEIDGNIKLGDNQEILIGTGSDLKLWHDGTHSYIRTTSGTQNLNLQTTNGQVILGEDGGHIGLYYQAGGTVELRYNNIKTFETVSGGSKVTGNLEVTGGNITLGDSGGASDDRIVLGAGSDLSIYHDGTYGWIANGTGDLLIKNDGTNPIRIRAVYNEENIVCYANGTTELYYNGLKKLSTTSTGAKLESTGTAELTIWAGEAANAEVHFYADENDDSIDHWKISANGADSKLNIQNYDGTSWESAISATPNGGVALYRDGIARLNTHSNGIEVLGHQTGSAVVYIKGKEGQNAILSLTTDDNDDNPDAWYVKAQNSDNSLRIQNKGSGNYEDSIVAKPTGAVELYYNNSKKLETTNAGIGLNDNVKAGFGNGGDLNIYHSGSHSYIKHSGTGNLYTDIGSGDQYSITTAESAHLADFVAGGAVTLRFNGNEKFITTNTGAKITGNLEVTGVLTYDDVTNIDSVGIVTARAGINVPDNQRINVGDGNDLYLKHDGTNSELHNNAGNLTIDSGINLNITNVHGEDMAKFIANGAVELYHDDTKRFETTSDGVRLPDGQNLTLGDGGDVKLKHQSTHFEVNNTSGNTYFQSNGAFYLRCKNSGSTESMLIGNVGGAVELYHNNSKKLETTSSGVTVTGTLTAGITNLSGELRANANIRMTNAGPKITFIDDNHNPDYEVGNSDGAFRIRDITNSVDRLRITSGGATQLNIASNSAYTEPLLIRNGGTGSGANVGIAFWNGDMSSTGAGAMARIKAIDQGNHDGALAFETALHSGWANTTTERLRITADGHIRIQWNDGKFIGQYYDSTYYMGFTFGATSRTLYIDNRSNDTRADIVFRTGESASLAERLRIDSSGRVMVGNTQAANMWAAADDLVVGSGSGDKGITIYSGHADAGIIAFADGTSDPAYRMGRVMYSHSTNAMTFYTNGNNERLRITSDGELLIGGSSAIQPDNYASHLEVTGTATDAGISILRYSANSAGPTLLFGKSRGASIGAIGEVQSGDSLGKIEFYGTDTNWESSASIRASADGEWYSGGSGSEDNTDAPGRLEFHTTPNGADNLQERLRITSAGRVGINETSPDTDLHIKNTNPAIILEGTNGSGRQHKIWSAGTNSESLQFTSGNLLYNANVHYFRASNESTEYLRITSSGQLLVGTTSSSEQFHFLKSHNSHTRLVVQNNWGGNATAQLKLISPTDEFNLVKYSSGDAHIELSNSANLKFYIGGSERLRITSTGLIHAKTRSAEVRRMILSGSPSNGAFNIEAHDGETGTSSGDVQGKLGLFYNDGSTLTNTACISFERGSGAPDGAMAFVTNQAERLRIDKNGKIIVATGQLHSTRVLARFGIDCHGMNIYDNVGVVANYGMAFYNDPNTNYANGIGFFNDDGQTCGGYIVHQDKGSGNLGDIVMATSETSNTPVERLRIASNGNVSIGGGDPTPSSSGYNKATLHIMQSNSGTSVGCQLKFSVADLGHNASDGGFISYWGDKNFYYNNMENSGLHKFYVKDGSGTNQQILQVGYDKVGINQTDPKTILDVRDSGTARFMLRSDSQTANNGARIDFALGTGAPASGNIYAAVHGNITSSSGACQGELKLHTNSGDNLTERLHITSGGRFRIKNPVGHTGLQDGRLEWWNENGAGIMAMIACNREQSSQAPAGLDFFTSINVDSTDNSSEGSRSRKLRIESMGRMKFDSYATSSNGNSQHFMMEGRNADNSWGTVLRLHIGTSGQDKPSLCFSNSESGNKQWLIGQTNHGTIFKWNWQGGPGPNSWGTTKMTLADTGNLSITGSYSSSDQRLKENITDITDAITKVKSLRGRTFTWQERSGHSAGTHYGFIAQEVQSNIPDVVTADGNHYFDKDDNIVTETNETRAAEGGGKSLTINYAEITPILAQALKEAISKIETLEAKVAALESA